MERLIENINHQITNNIENLPIETIDIIINIVISSIKEHNNYLYKSNMVVLTRKDFYEDKFWKHCCQEYEYSRRFLKSCGKPKDEYDKWLIQEARFTSSLYANMLREISISGHYVNK